MNEREFILMKELVYFLRDNKDALLMETKPSDCNCNKGKTIKTFRNSEAFNLNMLLEKVLKFKSI